VVLASNHLVSRAASALAASEESALVDRLVDTTEQIVFELLRLLTVVVVGGCSVSLLRRGRGSHFDGPVSDFVNHLTALHSLSSDDLHLLFRNGRASHALTGIDSHEFFTSHKIKVSSGVEFSIRDESVLFLNG
jgi:hypothetical protein